MKARRVAPHRRVGAALVLASLSIPAGTAVARGQEAVAVSPAERRRVAAEHLRAGRDAEAEPHLRVLVEQHGSVAATLQLALLRGRAGDPGAGAELLLDALRVAPNSEELLASFADLALAARTPERAALALEALARMSPSVVRHPYLLGVARMQIGDLAGAFATLSRAAELEPDRALTHVALGLVLNREKRYEQARAALERALRLEPGDLDAIAALAESEEGLEELDSAERHAAEVLAQRPAHPTANLVLGMVRMKQERFAEAREALARAVEGDPESGKAHYQLGLAYARLGDAEASRRHLERYREVNAAIERRQRELSGGRLTSSGEDGARGAGEGAEP